MNRFVVVLSAGCYATVAQLLMMHLATVPAVLYCVVVPDRGGLRVLRIGEPAKVRSCLQGWTLKAQLAKEVAKDPHIQDARTEQQSLRRRLRNSRRKGGEYMER